jgi:hypothetical protein
MRVIATTLAENVSITLAEDGDGWRFVSWSKQRNFGGTALPHPAGDAMERRFPAMRDALHFFKNVAPHS